MLLINKNIFVRLEIGDNGRPKYMQIYWRISEKESIENNHIYIAELNL